MALAKSILREDHNIIILTGSPIVGRFEFPQGIDYVRIPGMIKQNNELYVPFSIKVKPRLALNIRQNIIVATARTFRPSVFLVDKAPLGLKKEIVPALKWFRQHSPKTKVILGLRDIMDNRENTIQEWQKKDIYSVLDQYYSEIWVYGEQGLYDPIKEYDIPDYLTEKIQDRKSVV
jgi:predicted glycosyltransferase